MPVPECAIFGLVQDIPTENSVLAYGVRANHLEDGRIAPAELARRVGACLQDESVRNDGRHTVHHPAHSFARLLPGRTREA
jgi:hypothetical protein